MPLFVSTASFQAEVEVDLGNICRGDGGFGDVNVAGDPSVIQITYAPSSSGAGQNRLNDLVNNTPSNDIIITGVDSTFVAPDGTPINTAAGLAFPPDSDGRMDIFYDTSQCGGSKWFVEDVDGNHISFPNCILLFHELAHEWHHAAGDFDSANPEVQAENDENLLRTQVGITLRDPNSHFGGCGFSGSPQCAPAGEEESCFIVSAAYGSPKAPQVTRLIRLRDVFFRRSTLGQTFFARIFAEYYQFSPAIAAEMRRSPDLRAAITHLTVEPLLEVFALAERYLTGESGADLAAAVEAMVTQSHARLLIAGYGPADIQAIATRVAQLAARLDAPPPLPADLPPTALNSVAVLDDLAQRVAVHAPSTRHVAWALIRPIAVIWSLVNEALGPNASRTELGERFTGAVDAWLADVPIPPAVLTMDEAHLRGDLVELAELALTPAGARQGLANRLLVDYGNRLPFDLTALLQEAGYLPASAGEGLHHA